MRVSRGDEAVFAQLFYTWHNRLGAFVMRLTGSLPLAEEIVQEIFIRIWEKREKLSQVAHFHPPTIELTNNPDNFKKVAPENNTTTPIFWVPADQRAKNPYWDNYNYQ
ncbi:RNA polymerase sigma factor [Chitinophaga niastensis]|uniref:RNA polymerase sigma factor n=1 Tax=Chitinophaga niastensis TaxID=536980 RepID=UPI000D0D36A1|nr:sigma factor [Chitinophaga niastensis]